jgi:NAD(P)-dependent dehydrogenase (short-subunit alcohol dehydrogenase family)
MSNELKGRHAIVTGGSRGVGAAIAHALSAHGARVTVMGRDLKTLKVAVSRLAGAQAVSVDITDPRSVKKAFAKAGAADILVNNAGGAESAPFERTDEALWQEMLALNLSGAFHCTQAVLPAMRAKGWGRIVNIASTASHKGYPYVTAYCAAKHGLLGLTRSLALETARDGVTVNAISPGFIETEMLASSVRTIVKTTGRPEADIRRQLQRSNPQGRFVTAEEVASAAVWLCLPASGSVTGQSISVSGGEVMS